MNLIRKTWALFLTIALVLPLMAFGIVYLYQNNLAPLPYFGKLNEIETKRPYYSVPDFSFISQDGLPLSRSFVQGKIWIGNYFFTSCPSICPKMMAGLKDVQISFSGDPDIRILSFTVDPGHDSFQRLKQYAAARNINNGQWQLATGNKRSLYQFARKGLCIVATDGNGGPGDFIHSDRLVLVDRESHIRGYYDGTDPGDIKKLIKDIKRLK